MKGNEVIIFKDFVKQMSKDYIQNTKDKIFNKNEIVTLNKEFKFLIKLLKKVIFTQ